MLLSLASCSACLIMDDELNVLPTSSLVRYIEPVPLNEDGQPVDDPGRASRGELKDLAASLSDTQVRWQAHDWLLCMRCIEGVRN